MAGHFCLDRGHQISPNLFRFSDRPVDFHEVCLDNWLGLRNLAKNPPKKLPVGNSFDSLAVELKSLPDMVMKIVPKNKINKYTQTMYIIINYDQLVPLP